MKPDKEKQTPFDDIVDPVRGGGADEQAPAARGDESEVERLRRELDEARRVAEENQDLYLRERAELENFRKRSQRDQAERTRYAAEALARDILPVIDNLERALEHARTNGEAPAVVQGVELVLLSARDVLDRHGVSRIEAHGEPFDPAVHEAVAQVTDDSVDANHVVQQHLPGYRLHDRLLRPAQVSVSTGSDAEKQSRDRAHHRSDLEGDNHG